MLYTKGPWQAAHSVRQYGSYTIKPYAAIEKRYLMHDEPHDLPIKELRRNNGRLIARAPDMYEGIKALIKAWDDFRPELLDEMANLINIIREIENDEKIHKD